MLKVISRISTDETAAKKLREKRMKKQEVRK
jgi:hypothetical protein